MKRCIGKRWFGCKTPSHTARAASSVTGFLFVFSLKSIVILGEMAGEVPKDWKIGFILFSEYYQSR